MRDLSDFKEDYLLSRQDYGVLFPYMIKDDVKQIVSDELERIKNNPALKHLLEQKG